MTFTGIPGSSIEALEALSELAGVLPVDRPFTTAEAVAAGVGLKRLRTLTASGVLVHPMRGVYYVCTLVDDLALRIACLKCVVPEACVVTDRTAGWLWGANMILAPNDHLVTPRVQVFSPPGHRLRNGLVASGERTFLAGDVAKLDGLRVTTALRTACDLGRLLHRDQALAALDSLARLRLFPVGAIAAQTPRFAGYRGIVQFRHLAPLVDPGAESPGESILRLRWLDVGLPRPRCQVPVAAPDGGTWWLDIGLEEEKFAAEYDGEAFHTEDEEEHDESRRDWMRRTEEWTIVVARKSNLHGQHQDVHQMLLQGFADARRARGKR